MHKPPNNQNPKKATRTPTQPLTIPTKTPKKEINILWIDSDSGFKENEYFKSLFMKSNPRMKNIFCFKSVERGLKYIYLYPNTLHLVICSGTLSFSFVDSYTSMLTRTQTIPHFPIIIFCYNDELIYSQMKNYGIIRFVTKKSSYIISLINNIAGYLDSRGEKYWATPPFSYLGKLRLCKLLGEITLRYRIDYDKHQIRDKLVRTAKKHMDLNHVFSTKNIEIIENQLSTALEENYFRIYPKKCFIYKEMNRLLNKYFFSLPENISEHKSEIENGEYSNKAFKHMLHIIPFASNLYRQILAVNNNNFFMKNYKYCGEEVYKGINLLPHEFKELEFSTGKYISFPSFIFFSLEKKSPQFYDYNCVFRIIIPKYIYGHLYPIRISDINGFPEKLECLFPAGSYFRILGISFMKGRMFVSMEYLARELNVEDMGIQLKDYRSIHFDEFQTVIETNIVVSIALALRVSHTLLEIVLCNLYIYIYILYR